MVSYSVSVGMSLVYVTFPEHSVDVADATSVMSQDDVLDEGKSEEVVVSVKDRYRRNRLMVELVRPPMYLRSPRRDWQRAGLHLIALLTI